MHDCIVIGAGPGGIVCTKELIEHGVSDVVCVDRRDGIGGTFRDTYDGLTLTSSVTFSMFSDFWPGDDRHNDFWTKSEAVDYWTRYADHFGVTPKVRTGMDVVDVRDEGSAWEVELGSGEVLAAHRLVLATGNNSVPRTPRWAEDLVGVERLHVHDYRTPGRFAGLRVLVVGGGESASDVALEIAEVADMCWVSLRESAGWIVPRRRGTMAADIATHRGVWGLPREWGVRLTSEIIELERGRNDPVYDAVADLNGRIPSRLGIWGTYGTKTLALPRAIAAHGAEVVGEVRAVHDGGRRLDTSDGARLSDVDVVVFCTGYENRIDVLPPHLRQCDPRGLYKHVFHADYGDRIAWIGWARPNFGSQFPVMEMQARLVARMFSARSALPPPDVVRRIAEDDRERWHRQFEDVARRIPSLVDYHRYMDDLAGLIGCTPPLWRYALLHPRLWSRLVYGPQQATQFRLRGPGAKPRIARDIISRLPRSRFNHVVQLGLRGRARYPLSVLR